VIEVQDTETLHCSVALNLQLDTILSYSHEYALGVCGGYALCGREKYGDNESTS
jgi:hypothetical protein